MLFEERVGAGPGAFRVCACGWQVVNEVESYEIFLKLAGEKGLARAERAFPGPYNCLFNANVAESVPTGRPYWIFEHIQTDPAPEMTADNFRIQEDPFR